MNVSIVALGEFLFAIVGLIASGLLNLFAMAVGMTAGLVIGVIVMMLALPVIFKQSLRWAYADVMQDKKKRLTSYYLYDLTFADIRKREKKYVLLYGAIMVLPTLVFLYLTFEVDTRIYISVMEGLHVTFAAYCTILNYARQMKESYWCLAIVNSRNILLWTKTKESSTELYCILVLRIGQKTGRFFNGKKEDTKITSRGRTGG